MTLDHLMSEDLAQPVVVVMPDANGGKDVSLQCLNQVGGPQDLTYLAEDLPDRIAHVVRVQPPGSGWGVAGYSEGGFCAANMALQFRYHYGFAGVLSGYFSPFENQLAHPIRLVSPFGGSRVLQRDNTPLDEVQQLPAGAVIPRFWLGAGTDNKLDVADAELFWQELGLRQADVPLALTAGGGHNMATWQAGGPRMLKWMTQGLAQVAQKGPAERRHHPRRPAQVSSTGMADRAYRLGWMMPRRSYPHGPGGCHMFAVSKFACHAESCILRTCQLLPQRGCRGQCHPRRPCRPRVLASTQRRPGPAARLGCASVRSSPPGRRSARRRCGWQSSAVWRTCSSKTSRRQR